MFVFFGLESVPQMQISANITTSPFLPSNVVATNYPDLKLMTQIEETDLYQSCSWYRGKISLGKIFNRGIVTCTSRTMPFFHINWVEKNNSVTAAFVSRVQINDSGLYQVHCRFLNLSDVIIAQMHIEVAGITLR